MNIYLITYNGDASSEILKDRIKNLGEYYNLFQNNWLVESNLSTCEDIYREIAKDDLNTKHIVVFLINKTPSNGYWGFANNALWEWLKNHRS